ncbi:MAG TPA: hypothetical protein DCZ12_17605 [Gammaproteobacteria bacterium]|jgi:hypothetical protein|nr:hypothetical protein [Gammaproteobacteria bacterium]
MMKTITALLFPLVLVVLPLSHPLAAAERAVTSHTQDVPLRGLNKQAVEAKFGLPEAKKAAVGKPGISRWIYHEFTVYFENDYVIHSVKRVK